MSGAVRARAGVLICDDGEGDLLGESRGEEERERAVACEGGRRLAEREQAGLYGAERVRESRRQFGVGAEARTAWRARSKVMSRVYVERLVGIRFEVG